MFKNFYRSDNYYDYGLGKTMNELRVLHKSHFIMSSFVFNVTTHNYVRIMEIGYRYN